MDAITVKARAKINLALDVLNKRPDGYHEVDMIMETIDLADTISLETRKRGIEVECNLAEIPLDESNLAFAAARKIIGDLGIDKGIYIKIYKTIPVCAGLAGGSSNAAAVLKGINFMWNLGLSEEQLVEIGRELGADVPFCILNKTAHATGIGEKLKVLPPVPPVWIALVKPYGISVSTAWAYSEIDKMRVREKPDIEGMKKAILSGKLEDIGKKMSNVFEEIIAHKYPVIRKIKGLFLENHALGSIMSGSGPTVFGLFKNKKHARQALDAVKQELNGEFFLCKNYNAGVCDNMDIQGGEKLDQEIEYNKTG